jgi:hypothetical protein
MTRLMLLAAAAVLCAVNPGPSAGAAPVPADPPLPEEAQALVKKLDDPDPAVRQGAVVELRLLARRADIAGGRREKRGAEFAPKVKGLVPYLVRAAGDKVEANRMLALYALADTLDPAAVAAIRERVKDDSAMVRFTAAGLLTEFKDASGLDEMKKALARFREKPESAGPFDVEKLLASFERITGKSFGEIPANPSLSSDRVVAAASEKRYRELLDTWAAWWAWEPGK